MLVIGAGADSRHPDHPPIAFMGPGCRGPWSDCACADCKRYAAERKAWSESGAEERWNRARVLEETRGRIAQVVSDLGGSKLTDDGWRDLTADVAAAIDDLFEQHGLERPMGGGRG